MVPLRRRAALRRSGAGGARGGAALPRGAGARMSRVKVLHIITQLELGGAQQNTLYTCEHLDPRRFEALLASGPGGLLDADARSGRGFETWFVPPLGRSVRPGRDLSAFAALVRLIVRVRPDIVHTHSSK